MKNSIKLLTGLSHEMRSYLNAIVGFSYLIEEEYVKDQETQIYASKILSSCNQLIWLMESFINSLMPDIRSDAEVSGSRLNDFGHILYKEMNEILRNESRHEIILVNEFQYCENEELYFDAQKVTIILKALFINAVNSMKSGFIRLGHISEKSEITFYLEDSGQDYEKCREFFDSQNLDYSLTRYYDARYAINILLTRRLMNLVGGTLRFEPKETGGTVFFLTVPHYKQTPAVQLKAQEN